MLDEAFQITRQVGDVLDVLGVRWLVGGSLASSLFGVPRATNDIDLVADIDFQHVSPFVQALSTGFYVDDGMIRDAIRLRSSFNILHLASMTKVDIFVLKQTALAREEIQRTVWVWIDAAEGGLELPVTSPEDIVLEKLLWYEKGGRVSDRQWRDLIGVLRVRRANIDRGYLQRHAEQIRVADLLAEAIAEVEADG